VDDPNSWECKMHPDESLRNCAPIDLDGEDRSPLSAEDNSSETIPMEIEQDLTRRRSSSTPSASEESGQEGAGVRADGNLEEEDNEDENADIRALEASVTTLQKQVQNIVCRHNRVKLEASTDSCQTDNVAVNINGSLNVVANATNHVDGNQPITNASAGRSEIPAPCNGCAEKQETIAKVQRLVSQFLNKLFEDENIRVGPELAFQQLEVLVRNSETMRNNNVTKQEPRE